MNKSPTCDSYSFDEISKNMLILINFINFITTFMVSKQNKLNSEQSQYIDSNVPRLK